MTNDPKDIIIDDEGDLIEVDSYGRQELLILTDTKLFIKQYTTYHHVPHQAITLIMNNAKEDLPQPEERGTMRNLYNLFKYRELTE